MFNEISLSWTIQIFVTVSEFHFAKQNVCRVNIMQYISLQTLQSGPLGAFKWNIPDF